MTVVLIVGLIVGLVLIAGLVIAMERRRRFTNRGRGAISGRWNRRI